MTFLVMFLTEKKTNQRRISDLQIIYDGALCDNISRSHFALTKELQHRRWRNRKTTSVCYYLQFPNWKHDRGEKPRGLKHFTYWYLVSLLGARENNLLLFLVRNGSSLINPFVFVSRRRTFRPWVGGQFSVVTKNGLF